MKKKKIKLPRATWHIKPVTKVKDDDTKYNRNKLKSKLRKEESNENY